MPCFNSQASYEARHYFSQTPRPKQVFQFTGLIRGPTYRFFRGYGYLCGFNSQASYEARRPAVENFSGASCFNSQASYEARHTLSTVVNACINISIHRPHTRPDPAAGTRQKEKHHFNSQASYEARLRAFSVLKCPILYFNSQASYEARPVFVVTSSVMILFQFTGLIRGPTRQ